MRFVSTRSSNAQESTSYREAILNCIPADGGLYVPEEMEDLRRWIYYADENTSFASLAGSLTSALINKEFSPIICETIASKAFTFEPVLRKLDDGLYIMELYHGPSGTFKDFGVSYLASTMETILTLEGKKSIFLDATSGELGACMANAIRGKNRIKGVLVYPKGKIRGLKESDFVWNGGNIYPIEIDGTEADCHDLVKKIFESKELVEKFNLTVANTANIGRLLPQAFFYTYAFSRIKKDVFGGIYYAFPCGNYGNLVSGLYGWRLALPVNGFVCPTTDKLKLDAEGNCTLLDGMVPAEKRPPVDPASPSNLERLEQVFKANSLMIRSFVFPADVSDAEADEGCKELYGKYKVFADKETSRAYVAAKKRSDEVNGDEGTVVLVARNHPAMPSVLPNGADFVQHNLGVVPEASEGVKAAFKPVQTGREPIKVGSGALEAVVSVLSEIYSL